MNVEEIEKIKLLGNTWESWFTHVRGLLDAAIALEKLAKGEDDKATRILPVYLLVSGLCVECFLKTLWVKNGGIFVGSDGRVIKGCKGLGHDLFDLASLPEVSYPFASDPEEKELEISVLKRLQKYVEYGGRYPISKKSIDHQMRADVNVTCPSIFWIYDRDDKILLKILEKLVSLFPNSEE